MAKILTSDKKATVKKVIYKKADEFNYASRSRTDCGRFMDDLVIDDEVGGVLKNYMAKEKVRTYIKDGVLNAYTKELTKKVLKATSPTDTIKLFYDIDSSVIQKGKGKDVGLTVSRSADGRIFVISGGTILKWETALRKALELIAKERGLTVDNNTPSVCLHLAVIGQDLTDADKQHINTALAAISVKARFCIG